MIIERRDSTVVPLLSVVERPAGQVVYVLQGGEPPTVRQQRVEVGARQDGWIEIRAGVHTGEVEVSGPWVRGIAVHIGARVMSASAASQVLVSRTVRDLVAGSGLHFVAQGCRQLKGVEGEWELFSAS